ncbi:MAG: hypothetical protein ABW101_06330 [Candidatus Thiodiazotropha sp.]
MNTQSHDKLNIWALPKVTALRLLLLTLDGAVDIGHLSVDQIGENNREALYLSDHRIEGLSAYLFTYAQTEKHYGLELIYPSQSGGSMAPYLPLEGLTLEQAIEQLCLHFDLS